MHVRWVFLPGEAEELFLGVAAQVKILTANCSPTITNSYIYPIYTSANPIEFPLKLHEFSILCSESV